MDFFVFLPCNSNHLELEAERLVEEISELGPYSSEVEYKSGRLIFWSEARHLTPGESRPHPGSSKPAQASAIEKIARPSAGRHGGVLTQSQNNQFCLGIVCVGCRFRLFHVLSGDELTSGFRG
jgi:hypothetical protein